MAIYHLNVKIGRRSAKQSAHAAACYVLRAEHYESDVDEVLYSASGHMPAFAAAEPLRYWKAADTYERANGRLFRSIEFALPVELDAGRRRDLAERFARWLTAQEKLPYTLALHAGKGHNPHCHLLINERSNDGVDRPAELWFRRHNADEPDRGGAKKTSSLVTKSWLRDTRKAWADLCNQTLADAGRDAHIDHRTLEAQGIDRVPSKHLGPSKHKMLLKGIKVDIAEELGMTAADIGPPAPTPFAPSPRLAAPDTHKDSETGLKTRGTAPAWTVEDKQRDTVQQQAEAMGCELFWVGVHDPDSGTRDEQKWTLQQILENFRQLRHWNEKGREILVRPYTHPLTGLILVDGLGKESVDKMEADGYEPTVTLETAPDQYQVWVRVGEHITKSRRDDLARYLADQYGGDVDAAGANTYGKLAGFTTGKPAAADGLRPFVVVTQFDASGRFASGAKQVLQITLEAKKQRLKRGVAPQKDGPRAG